MLTQLIGKLLVLYHTNLTDRRATANTSFYTVWRYGHVYDTTNKYSTDKKRDTFVDLAQAFLDKKIKFLRPKPTAKRGETEKPKD